MSLDIAKLSNTVIETCCSLIILFLLVSFADRLVLRNKFMLQGPTAYAFTLSSPDESLPRDCSAAAK